MNIDIKENLDEQAIRDLIAFACDKNILVYDSNAKDGELTERLIYLMEEVMYENYKEGPSELYIPYSAIVPTARIGIMKIVYSIPMTQIKDFYSKDCGGTLVGNDLNLLLMVGDGGTPLIGSY